MREVAHDYQPQIQKYLEREIQCLILGMVYQLMCITYGPVFHVCTGTKNVAKSLCGNSSTKGKDLVSRTL